jgi:hypothetical protein
LEDGALRARLLITPLRTWSIGTDDGEVRVPYGYDTAIIVDQVVADAKVHGQGEF